MHKHQLFPFLLAALLLASCGGNKVVFDEEHTFDRNTWNRVTPVEFSVDIDNVEDYYNIDFTVSVDTLRYRYDRFPLIVHLTSPAGESRQFYYTVQLKENDRWRGQCVDGYRVVQGRARSYFSFNRKGTHRMDVKQETSQYDLEGVRALGVSIERTKVEYHFD